MYCFIIVSSMWTQNPNCCALSSVLFRCFNDNVTAINVTVAATEKGPELWILNRAPASRWDAQSACDALEVSKVIFHLSAQHSSWIYQSGPLSSKSVVKVPAWPCYPVLWEGCWGQGSGQGPAELFNRSLLFPEQRYLGPVFMGHTHTKSRKSGNRAAYAFGEHYLWWEKPESYSNLGSSSLILVNYTGERGSQIFIF